MRIPKFATLILLLALQGTATADGISVEQRNLSQILQNGASLITVESVHNSVVSASVMCDWSVGAGPRPVAGEKRQFSLKPRQPFVPGVWIVEHLYWNVRASPLKPGDKVLFVDGFVLSPTPQNLRKLNLLTSKDPNVYASESVAVLERDLRDFDLFETAYKALKTRGKLRNQALLVAGQQTVHSPIQYHMKTVPKSQQRAFLLQAVQASLAGKLVLHATLVHIFSSGQFAHHLPALAVYLDGLRGDSFTSLMHELGHRIVRELAGKNLSETEKLKAKNKTEAGAFVASFARYSTKLPNYSNGESVVKFVALVNAQTRTRFADRLLREILADANSLHPSALRLLTGLLNKLPVPKRAHHISSLAPRLSESEHCKEIAAVVASITQLNRFRGMTKRMAPTARILRNKYTCKVDPTHEAMLKKMAQ